MNTNMISHGKNIGESRNNKGGYLFVFISYCLLHLVVASFHEPWYDEAEAWQIAKCATIEQILFSIPHYEGHPPLWHLILTFPAKIGLPYELSLSIISLLFSGISVALFLKYAPFSCWLKMVLPFTYFAFYQYGVISRPYCMMMLAIVLVSITWKNRNEKPIEFVLSMAFLCLTSSYGIIIAGGISIVWVVDIIKEKKTKFLFDKRVTTLVMLLVFAVVLMSEVMPKSETSATAGRDITSELKTLPIRLLFTFLMLFPESSFTTVLKGDLGLEIENLSLTAAISASIIGIVIWAIIIYYGRKKNTLRWIAVPYVLYAGFAAMIYFGGHHIGIALLLLLFWAWITYTNVSNKTGGCADRAISYICHIVVILGTLISCLWTIKSVALDVKNDYYPTRNIATFIKDNELTEYSFMVGWREEKDETTNAISLLDTDSLGAAVALFPYFEHNFSYNAHSGSDALAYDTHKNAAAEENYKNIKEWAEKGYPDILFNNPNLYTVFGEDAELPQYKLVFEQPYGIIWKGTQELYAGTIYVRADLLSEIGLKEIQKNLSYYIHIK